MLSPLERDTSGARPCFLMASGSIRQHLVHCYYTVYGPIPATAHIKLVTAEVFCQKVQIYQ